MPRPNKDGGRTPTSSDRHYLAPAINPFSSGNDVSSIADWDTREGEMVEMILGYLANGQAIMFGVSRDGGAVSVGVSVGEKQWARKTARDEQELIGIVHEAVLKLREMRARREAE